MASIARTYDCSPPAISYVVSRSRTRHAGAQPPPAPPISAEPQLIKAAATEGAIGNGRTPDSGAPSANAQPGAVSLATGQARAEEFLARPGAAAVNLGARRDANLPREANGLPRNGTSERTLDLPGLMPRATLPLHRPPGPQLPAGQADGDPRRTLHLSLGQGSHGNGGAQPAELQPAERHDVAGYAHQPQHQAPMDRFTPPANPESTHSPAAPDGRHDRAGEAGFSEMRSAPYQGPVRGTDADGAHRKEGSGSYIDKDLRARVDGDIAVFLAAFDAALAEDTQESRSALRDATDRLLRVGARTRIELERLEARIPLPPRDNSRRSEPAWRQR